MQILFYTLFWLLSALCIWIFLQMRLMRRNISMNDSILGLMLKNTDAYILLIDDDFNVLQTNYYTKTGSKPAEELLKVGNLLQCCNGQDAGVCGTHELCASCPIRAAIRDSFHLHESFSGLQAPVTLYTSDGENSTVSIDVAITGNYLTIENDDRMLLTIHDITAQKRAEQAMIDACMHAEESDRMKSLFLANTSHEIRTPLNAIVGFSELLATDLPIAEKQEFVGIIRANSQILLQLVNDILDLSKVEAGTLEYVYADEDLNDVMEELEALFRNREKNSRVRIEFNQKYPACIVWVDRTRLTQVISNFLSNAVKYTPEGTISFGFEIQEQEYYFYVKDTGVGIPQDKLEKVFDRFVKIGSHKQGIGIGLAICKSIVESVGGRIGCVSQLGKGSTFWFTVPIEPRG